MLGFCLRFWVLVGLVVNTVWASPGGEGQVGNRTLNIGYAAETTSANFLINTGIWNTVIYRDLNELLVRFNGVNRKFEPGHAATWHYDENKGEYWFTIRQGLQWDDGTPIRAKDYVRSWRYYALPKEKIVSRCDNVLKAVRHFSDIKSGSLPAEQLGVFAMDDFTLRVELESPSKRFLRFLSDSDCYLLPFHKGEHLDFSGDWTDSQAIAYNGPYKLQSDILPGNPVVLIRNQNYWNKEKLFFDKIIWHAYTQRSTKLSQDMLEGRIHIAYNMNGNPNLPWMLEYRPKWVKHQPSGHLEYLTIQGSRQPLAQSAELRQALSMLIDRNALVRGLPNRQQGIAALSLAPQSYYRRSLPKPAWWNWSMQKRREKAKALLASANYGPSNPLNISLRMNVERQRARTAEALATMWKAVGVQTELKLSEASEHYQAIDRGDFEVARGGWVDVTGSPRYFFRLLDPNATVRPQSLKLKDWPQAALTDHTLTEEKEEYVYHDIEAQNQATVSIIPLYHVNHLSFVNPKLQGYNAETWWVRDITAMRWREEPAPAPK